MYKFNYHRPETLDEAVKITVEAEDAVYLSGGMTLIPTLKARLAAPSDIVDLSGLDALRGIDTQSEAVAVGAMTKHEEVSNLNSIPAVADLAGMIGDAQVRNRGTIGGSLANSDPAADYPAAVLGLGATIHTNTRQIAGDDFFTGLLETDLEEYEVVTKIEFPVPDRAAYQKFANPASRYAVVGVFVSEINGSIRVAVTGAGPCAFRLPHFENALADNFSTSAISKLEVDDTSFNSDIHASASYRANLVKVMAERAVARIA